MELKYHILYRVHVSGEIHKASFGSMTERAVFIISIERYADIVKEWVE